MESSHQKTETSNKTMMTWFAVVAGVLVIGFFAGMQFLKASNNQENTDNTSTSMSGGGGPQMIGGGPGPGAGGGEPCANGQPKAMLMLNGQQVETCGMPASGAVTNIGSDSITITDGSTGESKTFTINSDTKLSKKGGSATLSEITTSDKVAVIPSTDDATIASYVILNPPQ
jgi:hypothetical protein